MSPELDTLDQLLGGEMPLGVIHDLYPDDEHFSRSIHALLLNGDVRLLSDDDAEVPSWRWRELFVEGSAIRELSKLRLGITDQGVRRIA